MIVTADSIRIPSLYRYLSEPIYHRILSAPSDMEEIRIRLKKPVVVCYGNTMQFLKEQGGLTPIIETAYVAQKEDIKTSVEKLCHGSVYAYQSEIREGYITTPEGDRVGLSGRGVMEGDRLINLTDIGSLNFRFSHEIIGAADALMPYIVENGRLKSVLVISPPQCGKTTLLRDAARQLAERYKTVIIDERGEIAGMAAGVSHYDLGIHSEVLSGFPKAIGMQMALRSLSPQVMICDELGKMEDITAALQAIRCGVAILASIHAGSLAECRQKYGMEHLWHLFDVAVLLTVTQGKRVLEAVERHDE